MASFLQKNCFKFIAIVVISDLNSIVVNSMLSTHMIKMSTSNRAGSVIDWGSEHAASVVQLVTILYLFHYMYLTLWHGVHIYIRICIKFITVYLQPSPPKNSKPSSPKIIDKEKELKQSERENKNYIIK